MVSRFRLARSESTQTAAPSPSRRPVSGPRGFTLVELMVGILVAFIVLAGVIAVYLTVVQGSTHVAREARLNQETRVAMDLMVNDIRRAGYWRAARPYDPTLDQGNNLFLNRFMGRDGQDSRDITIHGGNCLVLSYDPTFVPGGDDTDSGSDEVFGFWLDGKQIKISSGDVATSTTCAALDNADADAWVPITSGQVEVTALTFDFIGSRCLNTSSLATWQTTNADALLPPCDPATAGYTATGGDVLLESRQVNIVLEAQHARDNNTRIRLTDSVKVRNDRILEAP